MSDKHAFPHHPKYYCTSCSTLLTAESATDRKKIQSHITNSEDADHQGRSGSSISAPITTTGTNTEWVSPAWKTEADSEIEQVLYLALLRYPHLPIISPHLTKGKTTAITELVGLSKSEVANALFDSPTIQKLRIQAAYEYVNEDFTREIGDVTIDSKERLIHRKAMTLARKTNGCSIKSDGALDLDNISASDIASQINEKQFPPNRLESVVVDNDTTVSEQEVRETLKNTVLEVQFPKARRYILAITTNHTSSSQAAAAEEVSDMLGVDFSRSQVSNVMRRRPWEAYDCEKISELIYDPQAVAEDFYSTLQSADLTPPASVEELLPDSTHNSATPTRKPKSESSQTTSESGQPAETLTKADGGEKAATSPSNPSTEPSLGLSLGTEPEQTANDLSTLIRTTLTNTSANSESAGAALRMYEQLPKSTRKAVLTDLRTEVSDKVFASLTERL